MQQDVSAAGNGSPRRFRTVALALVAGVAGGLVAPLLYPSVARNARPVTRKALKAGMAAFERGREIAAELGEQAGDLMAEARAEYDDEHKPALGPELTNAFYCAQFLALVWWKQSIWIECFCPMWRIIRRPDLTKTQSTC